MRFYHGLSTDETGRPPRLYLVWKEMRKRCNSPAHHGYHNYGGRGITVCERWDNFANFWADMQPTYRRGLTLERKDNDLGYTPANCTWVDRKTQSRNRRATRLTIEAATEIRKKHAAGATQISLAAIYKVGPTQISNIVHHRKWV